MDLRCIMTLDILIGYKTFGEERNIKPFCRIFSPDVTQIASFSNGLVIVENVYNTVSNLLAIAAL